MTFIHIAKPSRLERTLIVLTQGAFYNAFFVLYLISPRTAHRVVGYFEEEAVVSYTQYLEEIDDLLDEELPPYTSALDAAVPGENIVLALHSPRRSKWAAVHQRPDGEQVLVWAASEALARRIAALKATRGSAKPAGATAGTADAPPAAPKKPAPVEPDPVAPARTWTEPTSTADEEQEAESEWKILF